MYGASAPPVLALEGRQADGSAAGRAWCAAATGGDRFTAA
jgi:hypothetical protein